MTRAKIKIAVAEAERFLVRAKAVTATTPPSYDQDAIWGSKDTASLRRASLDLTRALAEMRKY